MREMKDSGVAWIGEIPNNWHTEKGKHIFKQRNTKGNEVELQLLSPTQKFGVIPQNMYEQLTTNSAVKLKEGTDLKTFKTIHSGDYCISLRSFQGGFEYSTYEGVVSPAYTVFFPVIEINEIYYKYLFKDQSFIKDMASYSLSLRDGKNISFENFGNSFIPLPPLSEQQKIASLLDKKCTQIDTLISNQEKQIEKLKAYKQSLITEVVTKGLNPDVPMKDSGVEWIGEIPEHWEIVKISRISDHKHPYAIGDGDHGLIKPYDYKEEGIPYIRVQNLGWATEIDTSNIVYISEETNKKISSSTLKPNDILFAKTGATIGKTAIIPASMPIANTTSHVGKITVNPKYKARYIFYVLSSNVGYRQFWEFASQKTTRPELAIDEIKTIFVTLPMNVEEQQAIVTYLDKKCSEIDSLIAIKQQKIEKLQQYKKSVIYEYVTGKKEVE